MEGDGKMACSIFIDSAEATWVVIGLSNMTDFAAETAGFFERADTVAVLDKNLDC